MIDEIALTKYCTGTVHLLAGTCLPTYGRRTQLVESKGKSIREQAAVIECIPTCGERRANRPFQEGSDYLIPRP